ncbi:MAG: FtsW/RodA/SpoVE family cell cycle protein, partial [Anaerostipes sp.]|nr:FtsW/RodA/SpoVE family cell cycle protein [Anaerostipes sp.]
FVVSPKMKELMLTAGGGIILLFVYLLTANSYRNERVQIWLHPESHKKGFQTMQALYAIGSGGIFGKGLGQSMQKMGFIPESHNDMIFSIICEELGLFGAVCLILVFVALIFRMLLIALNTEDLFGSLIVIGFMTHIAIQVFINIAVVTNTIPPTGIPLPFISYGGTSILVVMIEMGIVLSISKKIHIR